MVNMHALLSSLYIYIHVIYIYAMYTNRTRKFKTQCHCDLIMRIHCFFFICRTAAGVRAAREAFICTQSHFKCLLPTACRTHIYTSIAFTRFYCIHIFDFCRLIKCISQFEKKKTKPKDISSVAQLLS